MEVIKKLTRIGDSWGIIIPKDLVEFYRWENTKVSVEIDSDKIVIKKIKGEDFA